MDHYLQTARVVQTEILLQLTSSLPPLPPPVRRDPASHLSKHDLCLHTRAQPPPALTQVHSDACDNGRGFWGRDGGGGLGSWHLQHDDIMLRYWRKWRSSPRRYSWLLQWCLSTVKVGGALLHNQAMPCICTPPSLSLPSTDLLIWLLLSKIM